MGKIQRRGGSNLNSRLVVGYSSSIFWFHRRALLLLVKLTNVTFMQPLTFSDLCNYFLSRSINMKEIVFGFFKEICQDLLDYVD